LGLVSPDIWTTKDTKSTKKSDRECVYNVAPVPPSCSSWYSYTGCLGEDAKYGDFASRTRHFLKCATSKHARWPPEGSGPAKRLDSRAERTVPVTAGRSVIRSAAK